MAFVHLLLDGEEWTPRSQQREDNVYATRGQGLHPPRPVCGRYDAHLNQRKTKGRIHEEVIQGLQHRWW